MKKLFLVLVLCLCSLASWAQNLYFSAVAPTGQTLYYKREGVSVAVTHPNSNFADPWSGYAQPTGSLTIPSTVSDGIETFLVTSIDENAFSECSGLTNVTIPNSVTSIGKFAFPNCFDLTGVSIPNSVTAIGFGAFSGCGGLSPLYVPHSAASIGEYAFYGIDTVYYGGSATDSPWGARVVLPNYTEEGDPLVYDTHYKTMVIDCSDTVASVSIPSSVTAIGDGAFSGCRSLTSLTIPSSVTSIGECAFEGCDSLASVTIPNSVTAIGMYAFRGCIGLASVTIPSSVTSIGIDAFYNVDRIVYCGTATGRPWGANHAFAVLQDGLYYQDCDMTIVNGFENGLIHADIPDGVTTIAENAFKNCTTLTSVTIPESVTTIGNSAFAFCRGLTGSLTIPKSVTAIGNNAFEGCGGLTGSLTIPHSVTTIGDHTFAGCSGFTDVTIPNSVTTIEQDAFISCGFASVVIGSKVATIGQDAFGGCLNLKTVYNLSNLPITKGATDNGFVAWKALRVLSATNGGFTNHGAGENTLHQISTDYTVVAAEDGTWNHIPRATIPANFLYSAGGSAKAGGWRAKEVELTDDTSRFCAPVDFTADTVTYIREFADSHRSTLYLPFTAAIPRDFEVYEFSNYDNGTLYFAPNEDSIRAYTPYLVGYGLEKSTTKCVISQKNAKFTATTGATPAYTTTHGDMTFQGTLVRTGDLSTSNYGYKDGFFVQSGGAAHVNPFRCYFTYSAGGAGQVPPHTLSVAFGDGLLGIDAAETPATNGSIRYSNDVYDLMGRLVRKDAATLDGLPTGIYVWKGRKVLAR